MKRWLRQPDGEPEVEFIGELAGYWRSGHYSQREERSVMAEMLGPEATERLQVAPGRWHLPGTPP